MLTKLSFENFIGRPEHRRRVDIPHLICTQVGKTVDPRSNN